MANTHKHTEQTSQTTLFLDYLTLCAKQSFKCVTLVGIKGKIYIILCLPELKFALCASPTPTVNDLWVVNKCHS